MRRRGRASAPRSTTPAARSARSPGREHGQPDAVGDEAVALQHQRRRVDLDQHEALPAGRLEPGAGVRGDHRAVLEDADAEALALLGAGDDQPAEPVAADQVLVDDAAAEEPDRPPG